jgi:hypothetical protein
MNPRRFCVLLVTAVSATLAACSSSGGNSGSASTASVDPAELASSVRSAVHDVASAHLALEFGLAGQALKGAGDEKLSGGTINALDITLNLASGAGSVRLIIVDGKKYVKLPPSLNTSDKPYLIVTPNSSNAVVKQLASSLDAALSSASLDSIATFVGAAKSLKRDGPATVTGVDTTHYSVVVDVSKLPASMPGRDVLQSSNIKTIPVELYLDDKNRPIEFTEDFTVQGQQVKSKLTLSDFNQPVTITAPPANQVGS